MAGCPPRWHSTPPPAGTPTHAPTHPGPPALQARAGLLAWYDANHRILPWRRNPHSQLPREAVEAARKEGREGAPLDLPTNQFIYWVWVCEVMSQQTQVGGRARRGDGSGGELGAPVRRVSERGVLFVGTSSACGCCAPGARRKGAHGGRLGRYGEL